MWSRETRQLIELALAEDLGAAGDITTQLLPDAGADVTAEVVVRQSGVMCGLELGATICDLFARALGQRLDFAMDAVRDGDAVTAGATVASVRGRQAAVLAVERTLLNFLGRMSGVATLTRQYVEAAQAENPQAKVLDTRKTIPGWRELDKYAVRCGGGKNHRFGLYDAVLLKDNHLAGIPVEQLAERLGDLVGGGFPTVAAVDEANTPAEDDSIPQPVFIEVEVDDLAQFEEVCAVPAIDVVLLDNFSLADLRRAVELRDAEDLRGKLLLEASGGVTLETIGEIAATGVDRISVGALTHSAPGLDIGLDF
jgi:nicotinate-nucleotide pyrophosphorylase (carboxylating)